MMFFDSYASGIVIATTAAIHIHMSDDPDVALENYINNMGQEILGFTSTATESIDEAATLAEVSKDALEHMILHILRNHIDDLKGTSFWETAKNINESPEGWDPSLFEETDLDDVIDGIDDSMEEL